jgi:hypothetical protein
VNGFAAAAWVENIDKCKTETHLVPNFSGIEILRRLQKLKKFSKKILKFFFFKILKNRKNEKS